MNPDFERIKTTDPIVLKVLAAGGTLEDVIVALVRHAEEARALFNDMEIQSTKLMPITTTKETYERTRNRKHR